MKQHIGNMEVSELVGQVKLTAAAFRRNPLADLVTAAEIFVHSLTSKIILSLSRPFHQFLSCIAISDSLMGRWS